MSAAGTDVAETRYAVGPTWTAVSVAVAVTAARTSLKLESYEDTSNVTYFYDTASVYDTAGGNAAALVTGGGVGQGSAR
jgi:cytochrome c-type biogenesis protein CcmE